MRKMLSLHYSQAIPSSIECLEILNGKIYNIFSFLFIPLKESPNFFSKGLILSNKTLPLFSSILLALHKQFKFSYKETLFLFHFPFKSIEIQLKILRISNILGAKIFYHFSFLHGFNHLS